MSRHTLSSTARRSYWLGRYLERADSTARLVAENGNLLMDLPKRLPAGWLPLVNITGSVELFNQIYLEPIERNVTRCLATSCIRGRSPTRSRRYNERKSHRSKDFQLAFTK